MTFTEIVDSMHAEFPGFKLVVKEESRFMRFLFFFSQLWCPTYMTNYTTVLGKSVYMPKWLIGTDSGADVLRHERIHMRDFDGWKVIPMSIFYCLLPIGPSGRAWIELRGYKESMRCFYERTGTITDEFIDFVAEEFTSSKYLWMWPFPKHIRKLLNAHRELLYNKELPTIRKS